MKRGYLIILERTRKQPGRCDCSGKETALGGVRYTPLGLHPALYDYGYIMYEKRYTDTPFFYIFFYKVILVSFNKPTFIADEYSIRTHPVLEKFCFVEAFSVPVYF